MEKVLDVYKRPYDQRFPVICMDESPRQLIGEVKRPIPGAPGRPARYDYEYKRHGLAVPAHLEQASSLRQSAGEATRPCKSQETSDHRASYICPEPFPFGLQTLSFHPAG